MKEEKVCVCVFCVQTLNPFAMLSQFLGAGLVFKLCCCILFLGIVIASIFLAPFLGVVIPA